jgi:hypothetical protein
LDSGNGVGADNKLPLNASEHWNGAVADNKLPLNASEQMERCDVEAWRQFTHKSQWMNL